MLRDVLGYSPKGGDGAGAELLLCDKESVPPRSICHTLPLLWGAEEMLTHGKAGQEIPVGEQAVGPEQ